MNNVGCFAAHFSNLEPLLLGAVTTSCNKSEAGALEEGRLWARACAGKSALMGAKGALHSFTRVLSADKREHVGPRCMLSTVSRVVETARRLALAGVIEACACLQGILPSPSLPLGAGSRQVLCASDLKVHAPCSAGEWNARIQAHACARMHMHLPLTANSHKCWRPPLPLINIG